MNVPHYIGDRIYFRPIEPEDEPLLRRWINDPAVWVTLGFMGPLNALREREWIEGLGRERVGRTPVDLVFGIVVKDGDRLIGTTALHQLHPVNRSALFGILIGDLASQDRGYGTEATALTVRYGFQVLNLHRIELNAYDHNPRAIHVYEKVGFHHEGCMRQAHYHAGRYVDVHRFALLRHEWDELHKQGTA
jgi:RimJ/RimL family protein N-acetyltransferase